MADKSEEKFKSKIGGQALIEGIMMRGIHKTAMACRLSDGSIDIEEWDIKNGKDAPWYKKTPFIRGIFNLVDSLVEGTKCLNKSADKQLEDEDEKPSKFEEFLSKIFGDKLSTAITVFASIIGIIIAIILFMFIPTMITKLLNKSVHSTVALTAIEGAIKIIIFIIYLWLVSRMKEIKTTFKYHGAEHKTIFCYEHREELTVENVKKQSRFHPRCGTSFILIVLLISIIVFSFVTWSSPFMRVALKIVFLPVVIGIAYEIIKLAGRYDNTVTRIISAPGLWLQRLTTKEPTDEQIEVAIEAMKIVIPENAEEDRW